MGRIVRTCRLCKEEMKISPFTMCQQCLIENEKVQHFIIKNPQVSIQEIATDTNVAIDKIRHMAELGFNKKKTSIITTLK